MRRMRPPNESFDSLHTLPGAARTQTFNTKSGFLCVQCHGCDSVSFRKEIHDFETHFQVGEDEWDYDKKIEVYPPTLQGHKPLLDSHILPWALKRTYEETLDCIKLGHTVLAGIGLRATVEAICDDQAVEGRNLSTKISRLAAAGIVSKKDARNLQGIRFMGNDAAHDFQEAKPEAIYLALTIVEHIMETQYILSGRAEQYLELPVEDLEAFKVMLERKLRNVEAGAVFSLRSLIGKDLRRVTQFAELEDALVAEIQNGQYQHLSKSDAPGIDAGGIRLYRRPAV